MLAALAGLAGLMLMNPPRRKKRRNPSLRKRRAAARRRLHAKHHGSFRRFLKSGKPRRTSRARWTAEVAGANKLLNKRGGQSIAKWMINPLRRGKGPAAVSANIRTLIHEGYPQRQAIAIALSASRRKR